VSNVPSGTLDRQLLENDFLKVTGNISGTPLLGVNSFVVTTMVQLKR